MTEYLDFGPSRFKCPFELDASHCDACRSDAEEIERRSRMAPSQRAEDAKLRSDKYRRIVSAILAIGDATK